MMIKHIAAWLILSAALMMQVSCKKVKTTPLSNYKVDVIHDNYDETLTQAQQKDQNICLILHADWCSICKTFIAEVLTEESVEQFINDKMIVALIDGDKDYGKPYFQQYNASGFPTFLILDKQGSELARANGKMNKEQFQQWINPYLK